MLQEIMTNPGEIVFKEVPVPEIRADQVLIKIMNIGICGSDIHVYHGKHPFTKYPVTQGHEVSGEIVRIGAHVKEFHNGQKVTIEPQVYCGHCYPRRQVQLRSISLSTRQRLQNSRKTCLMRRVR